MTILRPASLDDVPALAALGRGSFRAAFEDLYQPQDLATFLAETYSDDIVAAEVSGGDCLHCLAMEDDSLLGFCKLRRPSAYARHSQAAAPIDLSQLYTDPESTGRGVGAALMDWALTRAREGGHDAMLLSVWSGNAGAQRFYARYGFTKIAGIHFKVGEQLDDEYLLELQL